MSDFRGLFRDNLIKRFSLNNSDNQFQDLENNLKNVHFTELNRVLSKCLSNANAMRSIITWSTENTMLSNDKNYLLYIIKSSMHVCIHKESNKIVITKFGDTIFECESDLDMVKMARDYKEYREIGKDLFDKLNRVDVLSDSLSELFGLSSSAEKISCTSLTLIDGEDPHVDLHFSLEFELKREELKEDDWVKKIAIKKDLVGLFDGCTSFNPNNR